MPRKINPISYRLGLLQLWDSNIATYGNTINFFQESKNTFLEFFVIKFLKIHSLEVGNFSWVISVSKVSLVITCVSLHKPNKELNILVKKLVNFIMLTYNLPTKVYLLQSLNWPCTSEFLKFYFDFKLKKNDSFKQVLKDVIQIANTQLNTKKIVRTSCGPLLLRLKGFKLKASGRFPNSRNQMSQSIQSNIGSIALSELSNYVEYSQIPIFTKSGVYSLHIWLLYTI